MTPASDSCAAGFCVTVDSIVNNDRLQNKERFIGVRIEDKEDVYPALKEFFGKRGVEV